MKCRFEEESVRPKREAGKPKEKREEIKAETGFDVNVHFATLSRSADSKRSRSDQREKQANQKRSKENSKPSQVMMPMFISRHCREVPIRRGVVLTREASKHREARENRSAFLPFYCRHSACVIVTFGLTESF